MIDNKLVDKRRKQTINKSVKNDVDRTSMTLPKEHKSIDLDKKYIRRELVLFVRDYDRHAPATWSQKGENSTVRQMESAAHTDSGELCQWSNKAK